MNIPDQSKLPAPTRPVVVGGDTWSKTPLPSAPPQVTPPLSSGLATPASVSQPTTPRRNVRSGLPGLSPTRTNLAASVASPLFTPITPRSTGVRNYNGPNLNLVTKLHEVHESSESIRSRCQQDIGFGDVGSTHDVHPEGAFTRMRFLMSGTLDTSFLSYIRNPKWQSGHRYTCRLGDFAQPYLAGIGGTEATLRRLAKKALDKRSDVDIKYLVDGKGDEIWVHALHTDAEARLTTEMTQHFLEMTTDELEKCIQNELECGYPFILDASGSYPGGGILPWLESRRVIPLAEVQPGSPCTVLFSLCVMPYTSFLGNNKYATKRLALRMKLERIYIYEPLIDDMTPTRSVHRRTLQQREATPATPTRQPEDKVVSQSCSRTTEADSMAEQDVSPSKAPQSRSVNSPGPRRTLEFRSSQEDRPKKPYTTKEYVAFHKVQDALEAGEANFDDDEMGVHQRLRHILGPKTSSKKRRADEDDEDEEDTTGSRGSSSKRLRI